jgi:ribosomal-protein-alanine N-acetyltransferase
MSQAGDESELLRVMVAPEYRRLGIGRQLIRAGLQWAKDHQAATCWLEVEATNTAAIRAYDELGFDPVGRRGNYYGQGRDAIVMRRDLRSEND